ncbi:hypothetical protein Bca52824_057237 [Brassica carinata]|uniref:Uncharacterized protein n=1 Tax=Brassica carinata TaxID=52824 RepID=A0A8X7UDH3_BRACI|nr:hypothetical protein Bca52824_057237 [Brassica carinata]
MDALLQVSVDGFRFDGSGSGSCCKPRNNLETQNQSSPPTDSPPSICQDNAPVLKYINDMLMDEEDFVEDNLALEAAERSFHELLHQPPPSEVSEKVPPPKRRRRRSREREEKQTASDLCIRDGRASSEVRARVVGMQIKSRRLFIINNKETESSSTEQSSRTSKRFQGH